MKSVNLRAEQESCVKSASGFKAMSGTSRAAIVTFAAAGAVTLLSAVISDPFPLNFRLVVFLTLAMLTAHTKLRLYKDSSISFLTSVVLLSLLMGGREEALFTAICGVSVQTYFPSRKLVPHRLAFNLGMIAVTVQASWWAYSWSASQSAGLFSGQFEGILAASSTYYLGNSLSVSLMIALSKRESMFRLWYGHFFHTAPSFFIAGFLSLLAFQVLLMSPGAGFLLVLLPVLSMGYYSSLRLAGLPPVTKS
jgi:hypothetical protein